MISKLLLGAFSALVALFSSGCAYAPPPPRIFGKVTQAGGLGIKGISIKAGDYANTATDTDGNYSLYVSRSGPEIVVTAEDVDGEANGGQFVAESTTVMFDERHEYEVNFELEPEQEQEP